MPHPTAPPPLSANDRRRRKIERQLRALRVMQGHFTTKDIVWAVLTIPGIALLCLLVAAKLHWLSNSVPLGLAGALAAGVLVWAIGRRWLGIAWLMVIALICIVLEDIPVFSGSEFAGPEKKQKMDRRQKLERAIARREALLRTLTQAGPRGTVP